MSEPKLAFQLELIWLKLVDLVPVRLPSDVEKTVRRYSTILSSIPETNIVEPLAVHPLKGSIGKYLIVDGNLRFHALQKSGAKEALCIIANEDESFTYNARISRLAPIQEQRMIAKAVKNGVPVERIATSLNFSVAQVEDILNLLHGLHPEAVEILETRKIHHVAIGILKKVSAVRQIEMAELMVSASNFSAPYARALLAATPEEMLLEKEKSPKVGNLSEEDAARLREEMQHLEADFRAVEESYGDNFLKLTTAKGYLKSLLDNAKVVRWLTQRHREILEQFETIVTSEAL